MSSSSSFTIANLLCIMSVWMLLNGVCPRPVKICSELTEITVGRGELMRLGIETELGRSYFAANIPPGILPPGLLAALDIS